MGVAVRVKHSIDCCFLLLVPNLLEPASYKGLFASDMLASDARGEA